MTGTALHLDPHDPADAHEDVRFGWLGDTRVAVWTGRPPASIPDSPGLAPTQVLDPDEAGNPRYAEVLPDGIRLIEAEPPVDVARYIVARVLRALAVLHAEGLHHGRVDERTVAVGRDGAVVLFGRGRRPGAPNTDVLAAMSLLPPGADITVPGLDAVGNAERMEDSLPPAVQARLAGWVRTLAAGRVDEVVRDLGPENDGTGLLDRYASEEAEFTADVNPDEDSSTQMNLGSTLWRTLAAPPLHAPPPDRFAALHGVPSRAVANLLRTERMLRHDLPAVGPVDAFVVEPINDAEDADDDSSHTAIQTSAAITAAQQRLERGHVDSLTPRPLDLPQRPHAPTLPPSAPPPPQVQAAPIPWGMLVVVGVATGAAVVVILWLSGMLA